MSQTGPIVCIEDDEDDQQLTRMAFNELQVTNELRFFDNGADALDFLTYTEEKPFLILCDVNLPLMNGIELRIRLNESEPLRKKSIPFIFLTTDASPALVDVAYDQTVQGFFRKADSYAKLLRQLGLIVAYWRDCFHPNNYLN